MLISSSSDRAVIPRKSDSRSDSEKIIPSVFICVICVPLLSVKIILLPSSDSTAAHGISDCADVLLSFSKKYKPQISVHSSITDNRRKNSLLCLLKKITSESKFPPGYIFCEKFKKIQRLSFFNPSVKKQGNTFWNCLCNDKNKSYFLNIDKSSRKC